MSEEIFSDSIKVRDGQSARGFHESVWRMQGRLWLAIMLRDMRSRFFGNGLGYVVLLAWPLTHMTILIFMHTIGGAALLYGDNLMAYLTSGFLPVFTFIYMSRFTVYAVVLNLPLLAFPPVKPLDLLIGHALLEVANACLVALIFFILLSFAGYNMAPHHYVDAFLAFGATMLLGFGFGILNGAIALMFRPWMVGYSLVVVAVYLSSGALIPPDNMPELIRNIDAYNPVLHCVEWMNSAFLDIDAPSPGLDKGYVLACGIGSLAIGLTLERFFRGKILRT